jgi:hypothetical protein
MTDQTNEYHSRIPQITQRRGIEMVEETQKNSEAQTQKHENEKIDRLMTGYGQHASPFQL